MKPADSPLHCLGYFSEGEGWLLLKVQLTGLRVNIILHVRWTDVSVPSEEAWFLLKDRGFSAPLVPTAPRLCSCTEVNGRERKAALALLPPICAASKAEEVDKKWKLPLGSEVNNKG